MARLRALQFVVAFLIVFATAMPGPGGAQEATPTPAKPPSQPYTGPGGSEALYGGMTTLEEKTPGRAIPEYSILVPSDPLPGTVQKAESFPLVVFLHGSGARTIDPYLVWIEHLVWRGAIVLYSQYERPNAEGYLDYKQNIHDDVRGALVMLEQEGVAVDLTRVAVVGHSLGAEQALVYAASAAAANLPVPTAVMSVAPGCAPIKSDGPCYDVHLGTIPATTRLLLVTEEYDPGPIADAAKIWAELGGMPLENRNMVIVTQDTHGTPRLSAEHAQALAAHPEWGTGPPDALDWYGTWKWLDALMSCAWEGEWCEYALGNTPEQRFMGTWSDGVPVAEPIVTDQPG